MQSTEKNIMWNFFGYVVPILITLIIIPFTIELLGPQKFGVLSLIWAIVGYSSFLDFGVGRALTHYISSNLSTDKRNYIPSAVNKVLLLLVLVSSSISLIIFTSIDFFVKHSLFAGYSNNVDVITSVKIAIITAFFVIISSAVRGVLEGYEEFKYINFVRLFSGISISVSPFIIYSIIPELWLVILSFLIIRVVEVLLYLIFAKKKIDLIESKEIVSLDKVKKILSFGIWSNLTNVFGSPMAAAYLDKAIVASVLGATALTYYSVPFDIIARFLILPAMITGVLFPLLSKLKGNTHETDLLTMQALEIMAYVIAPFFIVAIILAKPLMELWLGDVSAFMFMLLQVFAIGKFAESLNFILLAQIQALGRPDLTAKRHLVELPFYACAVYIACREFGLTGVAIVWALWAIIDLIILFYIRKFLVNKKMTHGLKIPITPFIYLMFFIISYVSAWNFSESSITLSILSIIIVIVFYISGWRFLLSQSNKILLLSKIRPLLVHIKLMRM